jgi:hypothetical protein
MIAHIFWYVGRVARSSVQDLLWLILTSFGFRDLLLLLNGDLAILVVWALSSPQNKQ